MDQFTKLKSSFNEEIKLFLQVRYDTYMVPVLWIPMPVFFVKCGRRKVIYHIHKKIHFIYDGKL